MKRKMTKRETREIRRQARTRKNRRLSDKKSALLMIKATNHLGLRDSKQDLPIIDSKTVGEVSTEVREIRLPKSISSLHCSSGSSTNVKAKPIDKPCLFTIGSADDERLNRRSNKNNRRLSEKQYKKLMKKATKELGLNEKNNIGVLDTNSYEEDYFDSAKIIDRLLNTLLYNYKEVVKKFKDIVRRNKIKKYSEQLAILNYLLYKAVLSERTMDTKENYFKIPMCLIPKEERINEVRKVLNPPFDHYNNRRILKTRGDIKDRPFRVIPDDEYFLEINGKKRIKTDVFDKMSTDKKIQWARYANLITRFGTEGLEFIKYNVKSEADQEAAWFAMKYACNIMGIPEFKGRFKNPYWILYRIIRYHMEMTSKENGLFFKMAMDHTKTNKVTRTIPILDRIQAIDRLVPTLKKNGLYDRFIEKSVKTGDKLKVAAELILGLRSNA